MTQVSEVLLKLDKLGFTIIFVDELKISDYTVSHYNYSMKGEYPSVCRRPGSSNRSPSLPLSREIGSLN
jgi:hypothetical protein